MVNEGFILQFHVHTEVGI